MCSSVFTAATGLQQHMVEHGLHHRPYDCPSCHLKFFFRAELDNHEATHAFNNKNFDNKLSNFNLMSTTSSNGSAGVSSQKPKKFFYRSDDSDEEESSSVKIKKEPDEEEDDS